MTTRGDTSSSSHTEQQGRVPHCCGLRPADLRLGRTRQTPTTLLLLRLGVGPSTCLPCTPATVCLMETQSGRILASYFSN